MAQFCTDDDDAGYRVFPGYYPLLPLILGKLSLCLSAIVPLRNRGPK